MQVVCPVCGEQGSKEGDLCSNPRADCASRGYHFVEARYRHSKRLDAQVGQVYGGFLLLRRLGDDSGQGDVYQARSLALGTFAAVKILKTPDAKSRSFFEREIHALVDVSDPRLLTVFAHDLQHDPPYLVTNYIDGQTFTAWLKSKPSLEDIGLVLDQTVGALTALHARKKAHRDIKPANIMVQVLADGSLFTTLIDLGLTKDLTQGSQTRNFIGTPDYMAPEQIQASSEDVMRIEPRTDLFALACIAFEAIYRRKPYDEVGRNRNYVLGYRKRIPDHDAARQLEGQTPPVVVEFFRSALAHKASERPDTAMFRATMRAAFEALIAARDGHHPVKQLEAAPVSQAPAPPVPQPVEAVPPALDSAAVEPAADSVELSAPPDPVPPKRALWLLAAGCVALVALALLFVLNRDAERAAEPAVSASSSAPLSRAEVQPKKPDRRPSPSIASTLPRVVPPARPESVASARPESVASARPESVASARPESVASARPESAASARSKSVTSIQSASVPPESVASTRPASAASAPPKPSVAQKKKKRRKPKRYARRAAPRPKAKAPETSWYEAVKDLAEPAVPSSVPKRSATPRATVPGYEKAPLDKPGTGSAAPGAPASTAPKTEDKSREYRKL